MLKSLQSLKLSGLRTATTIYKPINCQNVLPCSGVATWLGESCSLKDIEIIWFFTVLNRWNKYNNNRMDKGKDTIIHTHSSIKMLVEHILQWWRPPQ